MADKTTARLKEAAYAKRNSSEMHKQEDEVPYSALAQWWLDYGITRKITKRNCMTFPSGSKQRGFGSRPKPEQFQIRTIRNLPVPKTKQWRNW